MQIERAQQQLACINNNFKKIIIEKENKLSMLINDVWSFIVVVVVWLR